jgi:uncharacterized protein DUF6515
MRRHRIATAMAMLAAAAFVAGVAGADPPREGERREHVDARHQHNHNYLDRGVVVGEVPREARVVRYGGDRFWFHGGVWYRPEGPRYVVVTPPAGVVVEVLPPFFTTVTVAGRPYYYANDTYYVYSDAARGYQVIDAPPGVEAGAPVAPPEGAAPGPGGDSVFVYPRNGQSAEQQASDRYECHRWAVDQTGFDPTQGGGGVPPDQLGQRRADYQRATGACLDARGYTVR